MARIAVIGGTGYAGKNIVAGAVRRGHSVVSVDRTAAAERVPGPGSLSNGRPRTGQYGALIGRRPEKQSGQRLSPARSGAAQAMQAGG